MTETRAGEWETWNILLGSPRRRWSRLSCRIPLNDATDGLVVHLPETQI